MERYNMADVVLVKPLTCSDMCSTTILSRQNAGMDFIQQTYMLLCMTQTNCWQLCTTLKQHPSRRSCSML